MSTHTFHAPFNPRDLISERAARRAAAHLRTAASQDAAATPANASDGTRRDSTNTAENPQILRRWSVAELVAAAAWPRVIASAVLPPTGAHG
jgi:hypothetical protein